MERYNTNVQGLVQEREELKGAIRDLEEQKQQLNLQTVGMSEQLKCVEDEFRM